MNVKIGKHIKELRNRDGVTQDALAEALGVTGQAISKWENESGYFPPPGTPKMKPLPLISFLGTIEAKAKIRSMNIAKSLMNCTVIGRM